MRSKKAVADSVVKSVSFATRLTLKAAFNELLETRGFNALIATVLYDLTHSRDGVWTVEHALLCPPLHCIAIVLCSAHRHSVALPSTVPYRTACALCWTNHLAVHSAVQHRSCQRIGRVSSACPPSGWRLLGRYWRPKPRPSGHVTQKFWPRPANPQVRFFAIPTPFVDVFRGAPLLLALLCAVLSYQCHYPLSSAPTPAATTTLTPLDCPAACTLTLCDDDH
jgi:hypothetical protein